MSTLRILRLRILLITLLVVTSSNAEFVQITNLKGQQIEAELIGIEDKKVTFRMRNGRTYTLALNTLSKESVQMITEWYKIANQVFLSPHDRIQIYLRTSRDSDDTDGGYAGWQDMDERIEPMLRIENNEYKKDYQGLKATLVLFGENIRNSRELKVVFKDSFEFDLPSDSSHRWAGQPFKLDYLIDDNDGYDNSHGHRYRYYFIVIRNPDGTVGFTQGSIEKWGDNPKTINKLKRNDLCDRNLRKLGRL